MKYKIDVNSTGKATKVTNTWKLNYTFLNNQETKEVRGALERMLPGAPFPLSLQKTNITKLGI